MPKSDRSERKKSRRSRRAEAEKAELVAAADEEEGTVLASGGEVGDVEQRKAIADVLHLDDAAQDRMLAVGPAAYLRERALCAEDPNFCTSDDIPLNASVIALRRWENAQEERRQRARQ